MFEKASRLKLTYKVGNGVIKTEDLWDLSLQDLDRVAISLNKEIKESTEESFIKPKTSASVTLTLKFDIVKHIIDVKQTEAAAKEKAKEIKQKKDQLLELIDQKERSEQQNKSVEQLKLELAELEKGQ